MTRRSALLTFFNLGSSTAQQKISVRVVGGFVPSEGNVTALPAINCIYYAPIDMTEHLKACRGKLVPGGYVIFDMVDRSFDPMLNNRHITDDWRLPEAKRRPSQYVVRMLPDELRDKAAAEFAMLSRLSGTKGPSTLCRGLQRIDQ